MSSVPCPKCGEDNPAESAQCESCGHLLARARPDGVAGYLENMGPGTLVKGTYNVIEFVGEGGAGAVYVGEHVHLGSLVAIKALYPKFVRDDDMRRRFLEEAIIQANLNHPNIARVNDVVDDGRHCAIIMEFIDGSSLDKYLTARKTPPEVDESARVFLQILDGMSYAHAQGVVHRDVKPGTILLAEGTTGIVPKVTDFGIAKVLSQHRRTETGTAMGTIYYAAPEQLTDAKSVDHRADIYSLGCTFYEMLTLALPFEADTMFAVMKKHLEAPRPDPRHVNSTLEAGVSAAVMRAMAVQPKHRYQSCAEFAGELRQCLGIAPAEAGVSLSMPGLETDDAGSGMRPLPKLPDAADSPSPPDAAAIRAEASSVSPQSGTSTRPGSTGSSTGSRSAPPPSFSGGQSGLRPPADRSGRHRSVTTRSSAQMRAATPKNPVALILWGVIGVLAVGLALAALAAREEPEDIETEDVVVATEDAATPEPAPEPDVVEDVVAEQDDGPAEAEVVPAFTELEECRALATQYLDFDVLGDVTIGAAIEHLERRQPACEAVMVGAAEGSRFDTIVANLNAIQTRAVLYELRARRAQGRLDEYCPDLLTAVTDVHRGLLRIGEAAEDPALMAYEVGSLAPRKRTLTLLYVGHLAEFSDCPIAPIPEELLDPEEFVVPIPEAPEPEGSGQPPP